MIKVEADATQRVQIGSLVDMFRAKVIDVTDESLMIEITGNVPKVDAFINLLKGYNILEIARTGIAGLARGKDGVVYLP